MAERIVRTAPAKARGATVKKETGKAYTTTVLENKQDGIHDEQHREEQVGAQTFAPGVDPAFVRVAAGKTISLGNFNMLRIDVGITLPCNPTPDEIEETYLDASDFVAQKLENEEALWLGTAPAKKTAQRR